MPLLELIEEQFAAGGRTPKGQRARRAIFRATRDIVAEIGLLETSLELIADRAGLTQAALRHHFPTRDDLLSCYFTTATDAYRTRVNQYLADPGLSAQEKLRLCLDWHLEYMEGIDTSVWLEASAYFIRHAPTRQRRDTWYAWLTSEYAALVQQMRPSLGAQECRARAYAILSLVLGAWITHGRGSAIWNDISIAARRQVLIDAAVDIAMR